MLLRRVTEHVREQNWFAVFLDFTIVVFGVLIAFQVTDWNQHRQDRALEIDLLNRLHDDYQLLAQQTQVQVDFLNSNRDLSSRVGELILDRTEDDPLGELETFFASAFTLPALQGQSHTYAQMVSNGDIRLIENPDLRKKLVEHEQSTESIVHTGTAQREFSRPYLVPLVRLSLLMEKLDVDEAISQASSEADMIVATQQYSNLFRERLGMLKWHLNNFEAISELIQAELDARVGNRVEEI